MITITTSITTNTLTTIVTSITIMFVILFVRHQQLEDEAEWLEGVHLTVLALLVLMLL